MKEITTKERPPSFNFWPSTAMPSACYGKAEWKTMLYNRIYGCNGNRQGKSGINVVSVKRADVDSLEPLELLKCLLAIFFATAGINVSEKERHKSRSTCPIVLLEHLSLPSKNGYFQVQHGC